MKKIVVLAFLFLTNFCKAQSISPAIDTTVYSFQLELVEDGFNMPEYSCFIPNAFLRYKVIETNYKTPLDCILIRHSPSRLLKKGTVYLLKGTVIPSLIPVLNFTSFTIAAYSASQ